MTEQRNRRQVSEAGKPANLRRDAVERTYLDMTREELDARFETIEARSDARFERLFADMRTSNAELRAEMRSIHTELTAKIDVLAARSVDKVTAAGLLAAAIALVFSMIAFGGDQFSAGREISERIAALDAKIDRIGAAGRP